MARRSGEQQGNEDDGDLDNDEGSKCEESAFGESVGMEASTEFVNAEPGPGGDDISEHREDAGAKVADHFIPAGMQDKGIPDDDEHSAIFFGVPAPEASP